MNNNIPLFKVFMSEEVPTEVGKVLMSGFVGEGPKVKEFESKLKGFIGNDKLITVNSATSSLHLSLHLMKKPNGEWSGLKDGDEVLSCPLTCTATNWPILANNLNIKWVDVDRDTCNMLLDDLEKKLSPTTKVIMLVHWGGNPIDLDRVEKIKQKCYKLYGFRPMVIEDCAHSFGSEYKGKKLGNTGHDNFVVYSFQAIKHLTCVDGGCLILPNEYYHSRGKLLRWYGIDRTSNSKDFRCESDVSEWGFKFHMNDVSATIGLTNFKHIKTIIGKHMDNANYYNDELNGVDGIRLLDIKGNNPAYWIYTMKVDRQKDFIKMMDYKGINVSRVHERNDIHSCVSDYKTNLPEMDKITREMISIPVGWWLSKEEREYIVNSIKDGW